MWWVLHKLLYDIIKHCMEVCSGVWECVDLKNIICTKYLSCEIARGLYLAEIAQLGER